MICMMPQTQVVVSGQQHHQPIDPIDVSIAMAVLLLVRTTYLHGQSYIQMGDKISQ